MKKIFNLAVALSVLASSVALSSCDKDDPEDEPNNGSEVVTPDNGGNKEPEKPADNKTWETSIKVAEGETISIKSAATSISSISIAKIDKSKITIKAGESEFTIGHEAADQSYAVVAGGNGLKAASGGEAKADPSKVVFICNAQSTLSSPTLAKDTTINKANLCEFAK